ncbi:hypothetical protein ACPCHT_02170 [Nucisporomicrobium flavum]|jgi:drug/metabolite transporter (DMT)-like permease|uniref:hypothetical protein n=1 Tax=Nucisporomicrobium flavum TaxID=2785915 RepID=UPI0018F3F750|nr:hypothetical protein [Nucisporomicrobium flavum]
MFVNKYGKAIIGFLYAVAYVIIPLLSGDGRIGRPEWVTVAIAVVTAAGVYLVPLAPDRPWTKSVVAMLLAGLNVAAVVILDERIDAQEWVMIVTAALGAIGITAAPARTEPPKDKATVGTTVAVGWGFDRHSEQTTDQTKVVKGA